MRFAGLFIGLLALCLPAAAPTQDIPAITLAPGEAVTVRFDDGGRVGAPERGRAEWRDYELAVARHLSGQEPPDAPVPTASPLPDSIPAGEPIPEGTLGFRFLSIADRHVMLVIANGQDRSLVFRARMTRDGRTQPTDVCLVSPNRYSFEHWPHPMERIELYDFRFVDWKPGQPQPCA